VKKLAPYYCLIVGCSCSCGGKRAWLPLPPRAARLRHRQQLAAALARWQAREEAMRAQIEQTRRLFLAAPGGNA